MFLNFSEGQGVGLLIILNLMVPKCYLRHFTGVFTVLLADIIVYEANFLDPLHSAGNHLLVIVVVALQYGNAGMRALVMRLNPFAETGQGCSERRHTESQGLKRRIAPGLIVRREQGQVQAAEKVVVRHVEHAVIAIKVRRDEIHLHFVPEGIGEADFPETPGNGVVLRIHQIMRSLTLVVGIPVAGQFGHQLFVGTVVSGRNHDEGLDTAALVAGTVQGIQGVNEHIDALVPVFVTSADADENGVGGHLFSAHGRSHLHQAFTGSIVEALILLIGSRRKAVLKAVGRNHIHLTVQELGTFAGGDFAHGSKDIGVAGALLLQGVNGLHIEAGGHFVSVVLFHLGVQRQVVAG